MPLQGNSKKRKPLIWNRTFTLYLKILIIDKKRVYDDDIWKSQCLPPDSAGEGWIFSTMAYCSNHRGCTGFVANGAAVATYFQNKTKFQLKRFSVFAASSTG